jgi:hypothetical protein
LVAATPASRQQALATAMAVAEEKLKESEREEQAVVERRAMDSPASVFACNLRYISAPPKILFWVSSATCF